MKKYIIATAFILSTVLVFAAESPPPDEQAQLAQLQKLASSIQPQKGEIILGDGLAKATLPPHIEYLSPADTTTVLVKLWGNPDSSHTLGMLVPAGFDPIGDESWAVVMTYEEDGYVKDDDAAQIDYTEMLAELKEDTRASSKQRLKEGYGAMN